MDQTLPVPSPHEIEKTGDDTPAHSLYAYVWRMSGWHQVSVSLIAAAAAGLAFAPLELQRRVVDDAIADGATGLLVTLAAVFVVVVVVEGALKFVLHLYQSWLSESAIRYTREHLSKVYARRIASGEASGFDPSPADADAAAIAASVEAIEDDDPDRSAAAAGGGRAVSIIGVEVDQLGGFVGQAFVEPVVNIGTVVAILGYMLIVETEIALVAFSFLVPQLLLAPLVQRRINRLTERRVGLMRELGDLVANEQVEPTLPDGDLFQQNLSSAFSNRMRTFFWKFLLKGLINFTNHLATVCVLVFGGWLVIKGETSVGVVLAFVTGFERVADPMRRALGFYAMAHLAAVQHRMIARIL